MSKQLKKEIETALLSFEKTGLQGFWTKAVDRLASVSTSRQEAEWRAGWLLRELLGCAD